MLFVFICFINLAILGILSTDPDPNHTWLEFTFTSLFQLTKNVENIRVKADGHCSEASTYVDSAVHAYNILRVLFRDSLLGDATLPFVADGVIIAINGFKSERWPVSYFSYLIGQRSLTRSNIVYSIANACFEYIFNFQIRNAATLLFSALLTRIFGVKRSKTELSKKNSMTARTFFQRFSPLYEFLLQQITTAAEEIEGKSVSCIGWGITLPL